MKVFLFFLVIVVSLYMTGCKVGHGCPSNGKNVGAERILSGDYKTQKQVKRAPKFRS